MIVLPQHNAYLTQAAASAFTTLSPYYKDDGLTLSNGNLTMTGSATSGNRTACSRDAKTTGKWYFEVTIVSGAALPVIGIMTPTGNSVIPSLAPANFGTDCWNVNIFNNGTVSKNTTGAGGPGAALNDIPTFTVGDIIGVEVDLDGGTVRMRKNGGSWSSLVTITTSKPYMPYLGTSGASSAMTVNFGASAWHTDPTSGYLGWSLNAGYTGRYWRIWQEGNPTRSYTHYAEVELRLTAGGADQTSGGTASVSGTTGGSAANVFDGTAAGWEHAIAQGWAQYDFGSGVTKAIQEMMFQVRSDFSDYSTGLAVVFSDDASTWMPGFGVTRLEMTRGEMRVFTWDSTFTLPTQSDVTWNPSDKSAKYTLSTYNRIATKITTDAEDSCLRATKGISASAKGYFEVIVVDSSTSQGAQVGVATSSASLANYVGSDASGWAMEMSNGNKMNNGTSTAYGSAFADQDVIGIAFDNGKIWFAKNNVWQASGDPAAGTNAAFTGITGTVYPAAGLYRQASPTQKIGIRAQSYNLTYSPPSGFPPWGEA